MKRLELEPFIKDLADNIETDGDMNYVICKLLDAKYNRESYSKFNSGMGVLECVKQEYYRRRIVPYESTKLIENGEVFE